MIASAGLAGEGLAGEAEASRALLGDTVHVVEPSREARVARDATGLPSNSPMFWRLEEAICNFVGDLVLGVASS
jgi:hypothetical protein